VLLADGLFREKGVFYVMPKIDITPLAEMFLANVLKMLKKGAGSHYRKSSSGAGGS